MHIKTNLVRISALSVFLMSCNPHGFQHCLFNEELRVKGSTEWVSDSTIYLLDDSLPGKGLPDVHTDYFTADGDWHGSSSQGLPLYDTSDIDSSFDITGKFTRDRLLRQDDNNHLKQKQENYAPHSNYNTEDDYVSTASGMGYLRYKYKYDDNCNVLQLEQFNEDISAGKKYIFLYNDRNNLIECKLYDGNNVLIKQVKYEYDKNNNATGYAIHNNKSNVTINFSFIYDEYDTKGNWQKRVKYKNGKRIAITHRSIKYF